MDLCICVCACVFVCVCECSDCIRPLCVRPCMLKVTVQFETEGYGQNEIVSHMDISEVKL